eukprot:2400831-Amphidinium_carterae.3
MAEVSRKAGSRSYQHHVVNILSHRDMSARTLQSLQKKGVQEIHRMPTSGWHAVSGGNRLTHCPLQKHSSVPRIHVQSSIQGI